MLLETGNCTEISAYSFMSSILSWMAYASPLSCEALDVAKTLIASIRKKRDWPEDPVPSPQNPYYSIIHQASPTYQFYSHICTHITTRDLTLARWLERLSSAPASVLLSYKHLLGGLFLQTKTPELSSLTSKILVKISKDTPDFAPNILSLILNKLTTTKDITDTKQLLFTVPDLAVSKENMPTIIHALDTLYNSEPPLKYAAIELYLRVWEVEPRAHRYLLSALVDLTTNDSTFLATVTCARAMKFICERRPEQGAELVPLLSQILNKCKSNTGSAASALALGGISALCVSGIADVCSTWRVLSPRMNEEKRTVVIRSICEFFGDIPSASSYVEDEFNQLLGESLRKLWCYAASDNLEIVQAAFQALSGYKIQQMRVSYLPDSFTGAAAQVGICKNFIYFIY